MSAGLPSSFLELCQRAASETSVSQTGPSDTTTQTGRLKQIVNWVQAAWLDIQTLHDDWLFLRFGFTVNTTSGDGEYAFGDCTDTTTSVAIANWRRWVGDKGEECEVPMKIYLVSAGQNSETDLEFMDYRDFAQAYLFGTPSNSYPRSWTRSPSGTLLLGPKPDGIYTVTGEYIRSATAMSSDNDTPAIPAEYRMAIVYRAMMKYGRYQGASEVYADGLNEYTRMVREMKRTQRPRDLVGPPLA